MRIECPSCHFSADVDSARIHPKGANTRCPKCSTAFFVTPAEPVTLNDEPEKMTCPKCGAWQDSAAICGLCGIVIEKYLAAEKQRQMMAVAAETEPVMENAPLPTAAQNIFHFGYGRGEIMMWAEEGHLTLDGLPNAFSIAGTLPGRVMWRRFLDGLALWMGTVFLAAAVIFFFAYNWKELGHFARFGIVELLLASAILVSWRLGLERMSGKAALLLATLLIGALLVLVGQTYQTGADPWELFATWALFALPWVAVARFSPLWLVLLALVNLAIGLYYHAFAGLFGVLFGTETLWWVLAGVNSAALVAWELAAGCGVTWLAERWAPRIVATAAAGFLTLLVAWGIIDRNSGGFAEFIGYAVWLGCAYAVYRHKVRDLYVLALGVLSLVIVTSVFLGHNLVRNGDAGAFLFVGMAVLGLSAAGGWWLRSVAQEVGV